MKSLKIILLALLFTTTYLHAQWEVQLDVQNFTHLDRIFFLDDNLGWSIGSATMGFDSPYFYTIDGGENWYLHDWQIQGTDIVFVNPDTGFMAAYSGIIRKTINGGQNLIDIQTPATHDVMRLFFVDENNGWAVLGSYSEGNILHSENNGNCWEIQSFIESNTANVGPIYFISEIIGWGVGDYFENGNYYSVIKNTLDSGETWDEKYISINQLFWFQDIYFVDYILGWVVGSKSLINSYLILHTNDGGEIWEEQIIEENPAPEIVHCVYFVNDTTGWIGVTDPYSIGAIYFTNNGGENWYLQQEFEYAILDIHMLNQDTGWAVGGDYIYYTTNGDSGYITDIHENEPVNDFFKIIPNPTYGNFRIEIDHWVPIANYQLLITNITGTHIIHLNNLSIEQLNNETINISKYPSGIYYITINYYKKDQTRSQTKKLVKL